MKKILAVSFLLYSAIEIVLFISKGSLFVERNVSRSVFTSIISLNIGAIFLSIWMLVSHQKVNESIVIWQIVLATALLVLAPIIALISIL
ncbi:hypothetical protein [Paenibacillus sp. WLX2291]|uniref:hypothetical protein n=1 Tax=Paenibacillus sp. WLX2291 TaxID=3296934 RepID=UPI0039845866